MHRAYEQPGVSAALALPETNKLRGRDLITAIALGYEISCRVGSVCSSELHQRGFHPTGCSPHSARRILRRRFCASMPKQWRGPPVLPAALRWGSSNAE
ncbi:MAG: MmgE/PrpD family protein [Bryobacterales bacterium]|nr:MmgE/PrpD family protein [Bryobacterales bacterium]